MSRCRLWLHDGQGSCTFALAAHLSHSITFVPSLFITLVLDINSYFYNWERAVFVLHPSVWNDLRRAWDLAHRSKETRIESGKNDLRRKDISQEFASTKGCSKANSLIFRTHKVWYLNNWKWHGLFLKPSHGVKGVTFYAFMPPVSERTEIGAEKGRYRRDESHRRRASFQNCVFRRKPSARRH